MNQVWVADNQVNWRKPSDWSKIPSRMYSPSILSYISCRLENSCSGQSGKICGHWRHFLQRGKENVLKNWQNLEKSNLLLNLTFRSFWWDEYKIPDRFTQGFWICDVTRICYITWDQVILPGTRWYYLGPGDITWDRLISPGTGGYHLEPVDIT